MATRRNSSVGVAARTAHAPDVNEIVQELSQLIDAARSYVATTVNEALTSLYWTIGHRVRTEILDERRAAYGAKIVSAVGRQLAEFDGRGFDEKSLRPMIRFAETFPDSKVVAALRRRLTLTRHLRWLDRYEQQPDEEAPQVIILCAGKKRETVEILDLGAGGSHVAEYLTELPPREVLEARLHQAVATARGRLQALQAASDEETP